MYLRQWLLWCTLLSGVVHAEEPPAAYQNQSRALHLLQQVVSAHFGAKQPLMNTSLTAQYRSEMVIYGHYRYPGESRPLDLKGEVILHPRGAVMRKTQTRAEEWQAKIGPSVFKWRAGEEGVQVADDERNEGGSLLRSLPQAVLMEALRQRHTLIWIGGEVIDGKDHDTLAFTPQGQLTFFLAIQRDSKLLRKVSVLEAHPGYGDVVHQVEYLDYADFEGFTLPKIRLAKEYGRTYRWQETMSFTGFSWVRGSAFAAWPREIRAALTQRPSESEVAMEVHHLGKDLFALALPEHDAKSLLIGFADFAVLLEVGHGSPQGEALLRKANFLLPDKPLRYVSFSHHHPTYTWGLRPFIASGVSILAAPKNEEYLKGLAARPHLLQPDRLAQNPKTPKIKTVDGQIRITDGQRSLAIFDLGLTSQHTENYLVFYLEDEALLFVGDLGYFPMENREFRAGPRLRGLPDFLHNKGIEPKMVTQSWPYKGQKMLIPYADIKAAVQRESAPATERPPTGQR